MRKKTDFIFLCLAVLLFSACGGLGTSAILNPAAGLNESFLFPENSATKNDNHEIDEEDEVLNFADGSIAAFDENGNIIVSDNPSASFNNPSSEDSFSADEISQDSFSANNDNNTYAYAPDPTEDDSFLYNDIPTADDFDNVSSENPNADTNSSSNPENDFSNSIDVTDQENPDASVELNNDPLQELAHLPAPIAKTTPSPNTDIFDTDDSADDDPDEDNDCGDDGEDVLIIDDEGGGNGDNEFDDPLGGGPAAGNNSNSSDDFVDVGVVDCGDEEETTENPGSGQQMQFGDGNMELMVIQTTQNTRTGKWELADAYVIVAAERNNSGKINFKVDRALLTGTLSAKPARLTKTHFILQRN